MKTLACLIALLVLLAPGTLFAAKKKRPAKPALVLEAAPEQPVATVRVTEAPRAPVIIDDAPAPGRPSLFCAAVGGGVMQRTLTFSDDLFKRFAGSRVIAAPMITARMSYDFGGHFAARAMHGLGVFAYGGYILSPSSRDAASNTSVSSSFYSFGGGLQYGYKVGVFTPKLRVAAERQVFQFAGSTLPGGSLVASTEYWHLMPAIAFTLAPTTWLTFDVGAAYVATLTSGALQTLFPHASSIGVDATASAALALGRGFQARISTFYRRLALRFNPSPGDSYIAAGAIDQSFGADLALQWVY